VDNVEELTNAVVAADGNQEQDDIINLAPGTYNLLSASDINSESGNTGLPVITSRITINGASRNSSGGLTTTIRRANAAPSFRIFSAHNGDLTLDRLIISNGRNDKGGGAILVPSDTRLTLRNSTVVGNAANGIGTGGSGGGIFSISDEVVSLINSTVRDNDADLTGGGIFNDSGSLVLFNSTVSGNEGRRNGGIHNQGSMTIRNSTIRREHH
jgi:hypothetical protein